MLRDLLKRKDSEIQDLNIEILRLNSRIELLLKDIAKLNVELVDLRAFYKIWFGHKCEPKIIEKIVEVEKVVYRDRTVPQPVKQPSMHRDVKVEVQKNRQEEWEVEEEEFDL